MRIILDFETYSTRNLSSVGPYVYAQMPETHVHVACVGLYQGVKLSHGAIYTHRDPTREQLDSILGSSDVKIIAHNASFERLILAYKFDLVYPVDKFIDTAAMCGAAGLPRSLAGAAEALQLESNKDMEGRAQMLRLSRPKSDGTRPTREEFPEAFAKLDRYCAQDIIVTSELLTRVPALTERESRIYCLTEKMNDKGMDLDLPSLHLAKAEAEKATIELEKKWSAIFPGVSPRSPIKVADALGLPDATASTIRRALKDVFHEHHDAISILAQLKKSSVAKLDAFLKRVSIDGKLRGSLVYAGAERTARWAGTGVQLQNMPRGMSGAELSSAFDVLNLGFFLDFYPNAMETISKMLRGMLLGPFFCGDYAQIEARVLAWLAGEFGLLRAFADGIDNYKAMAARIYNTTVDKIDKDQRFMGKQAILGCGFGLGWRGFIRMLATIYDMDITPEFAQKVVGVYRQSNPKIVALWYAVNDAAVNVVRSASPAFTTHVGKISFSYAVKPFKHLRVTLPNGRCLRYLDPMIEPDPDTGREGLTYYGRNQKKGGAWERVRTYGGKLVENAVQAIAREIMADALLRLDEKGFDLRCTFHDEAIALSHNLREHNEEEFETVMRERPDWCQDLPIEVDVKFVDRYQK